MVNDDTGNNEAADDTAKDIPTLMAPYRTRIDALDKDIVKLLRARYDIIEDVARFKYDHDIPAVLQGRVDEVRENAAAHGASLGLDDNIIRDLYAQIIAHSCALEDTIKNTIKADIAQQNNTSTRTQKVS